MSTLVTFVLVKGGWLILCFFSVSDRISAVFVHPCRSRTVWKNPGLIVIDAKFKTFLEEALELSYLPTLVRNLILNGYNYSTTAVCSSNLEGFFYINQRCGFGLASIRFRIQLFISMRVRIRIRIQEAKPMRFRIRILVRLLSHKKLNFYMKKIKKIYLK